MLCCMPLCRRASSLLLVAPAPARCSLMTKGIVFSTDWLSTDDLGQDVGERAKK